MTFRDKFWTVFTSMLAAGGISYGTATTTKPPAVTVNPVTYTSKIQGQFTSKAEQRKIAAAWGELDQQEVNALAVEFKKLGKRDVVVFCANDEKCGDMALDFINAIGTAKWDFDQEVPLIDKTVGIGVSDKDVADAIRRAAPRLPVVLVEANMRDKIALVIGKKQ